MSEMRLLYIGEHFYAESVTIMSSIYHEDGTRSDWGKVQIHLSRGGTVQIRQATESERAKAEAELRRIKAELEASCG